MSNLRADLADAAARRAAIIDGYQMGNERANCMACRAKGLIGAAVIFVAGLVAIDKLSKR